MFAKKLKIIVKPKIFSLCLASQSPAIRLKFICKRKLKIKNKIEHCKIIPEVSNFSEYKTFAISGQKINKNPLKIIQIIIKIFEKFCFIIFIFSFCQELYNSEKIGIRIIKIGQRKINGIFIILR